jgi:Tfp pilus assembly protein PilF
VLIQQARSHMALGEHPQAAASLERAIRIEPGNPWLWLELARVHYAAGELRQAEAHARKAASLAGTDDAARRAADALLAEIRG